MESTTVKIDNWHVKVITNNIPTALTTSLKNTALGVSCHWNFGPGKICPATKISAGKNGPPDHIFW